MAKCQTMQLAVYLAKEVAAILRAVLTHDTKKLYNEGTVHLLCSIYWIQPIYQLLHSSPRYNATREGERKRPDMLLGPQKPARGQSKQATKQEELNTLPAPEEVLVTLRLQVDSCGPSDVSALIQILLGRTPIRCRNHHLWIQAVQDYLDDVPLYVPCCQRVRDSSSARMQSFLGPTGWELSCWWPWSFMSRLCSLSWQWGPCAHQTCWCSGRERLRWGSATGQHWLHSWVAMIWVASTIMIFAYALTSIVSQFTAAYLCAHGYVLAVDGRLPYICTTSATLPHPTDGLPIPLGLREWSWCLICYSVPVNTGIWADAWLIPDLLKSMWENSRLAPIVAFVYCISCECPMFRWEAFWEASPVPRHCYMVFYLNMVTVSC